MSTTSHHVTCPTCGHVGRPITNPDYIPLDVKRGSAHHRVLKALNKKPRTADEVARKVGLTPNEVGARLLELRRGGHAEYVIDKTTGRVVTRLTSRKGTAKVQRITLRGKSQLGSIR
jgi:transcription initiation factor IIE alpha subunit